MCLDDRARDRQARPGSFRPGRKEGLEKLIGVPAENPARYRARSRKFVLVRVLHPDDDPARISPHRAEGFKGVQCQVQQHPE